MRDGVIYSRELVRETVGLSTNCYEKLANVCYDRSKDQMYCNIEQNDPTVDVAQLCDEMEQRFQVYRNCLGRSQIDTIVTHYPGHHSMPCQSRFMASCTSSRAIICTRLTSLRIFLRH